jgi:hypothetical protein
LLLALKIKKQTSFSVLYFTHLTQKEQNEEAKDLLIHLPLEKDL